MIALLEKIDVSDIVVRHFGTLRDDATGRRSWPDLTLFFAVPAAVALLLWVWGVRVSDNAVGVMVNALAILAGLLFNLLVMLQQLTKPDPKDTNAGTVVRLRKEIYANIAYAIVVSLVSMVPLIFAANYRSERGELGQQLAGVVVVFLVSHFILTMGMILNRMHVMLHLEFRRPPTSRRA